MATHYTAELAELVTAFAMDDLVRFSYPEWHGDVTQRWYSSTKLLVVLL